MLKLQNKPIFLQQNHKSNISSSASHVVDFLFINQFLLIDFRAYRLIELLLRYF